MTVAVAVEYTAPLPLLVGTAVVAVVLFAVTAVLLGLLARRLAASSYGCRG